jgi:serine/threonine protein phosphatase PrpC
MALSGLATDNKFTVYTTGAPVIPASPRRIKLSPPTSPAVSPDLAIGELGKTIDAPWGAFNQAQRANEDTYQVKRIGRNLRYYAVFDGHGAPHQREGNLTHVAEYAQLHLHERIATALMRVDPNDIAGVIATITAAFVDFDREMFNQKLMAGSTATVIIIDDARNIIYQVNLGDSRSIIYESGGHIIAETTDHKPTTGGEAARIRDAGGFIYMGRVAGSLALSRAFGDFDYKLRVNDPTQAYDPITGTVSAVPTITTLPKVPHSHIIITSDAPFERNTITNQDLVTMAERERTLATAQGLTMTLGDNITTNMVKTIVPQTTDDTTVLYIAV